MHECPICGMDCDCDGEDVWQEAPADCTHVCDELDKDAADEEDQQ